MKPFAVVTGAAGGAVAALCCLAWAPLLGVLGAVGLGFLLHDAILLPALAGFLALLVWGVVAGSREGGPTERSDTRRSGEIRGRRALLGWGLPIVAITIGSFVPDLSLWLWIPAFAVMGGTCLVNARRCRRVHCYVTGPLFLAMTGYLVGVAAGVLPEAWIGAASATVVLGVGLAFGLELVTGTRYLRGA